MKATVRVNTKPRKLAKAPSHLRVAMRHAAALIAEGLIPPRTPQRHVVCYAECQVAPRHFERSRCRLLCERSTHRLALHKATFSPALQNSRSPPLAFHKVVSSPALRQVRSPPPHSTKSRSLLSTLREISQGVETCFTIS